MEGEGFGSPPPRRWLPDGPTIQRMLRRWGYIEITLPENPTRDDWTLARSYVYAAALAIGRKASCHQHGRVLIGRLTEPSEPSGKLSPND